MNELYWILGNPCTLLLIPALWFVYWYRRRHPEGVRPEKKVRDTRRVDDGWMDR